MDDIHGKLAFVTGSSQGLGRVMAKQLAAEGCRVIVNYANHADNAEAVAKEIRAAGGDALVVKCDVSNEKEVNDVFAKLKAEQGGVDILVNNARMDPWKRKPEMTEGEWFDAIMSINLKGAFLCCKAFFDNAKDKGWGRIVNISSSRAFVPAEPNMIAYGISKLGMHGLTRSYAEQGAKIGITANTVAPGMILTENLTKRISAEKLAEEESHISIGRGGTCEEIGDAVIFVLKNGNVTGETININGGMYYAP